MERLENNRSRWHCIAAPPCHRAQIKKNRCGRHGGGSSKAVQGESAAQHNTGDRAASLLLGGMVDFDGLNAAPHNISPPPTPPPPTPPPHHHSKTLLALRQRPDRQCCVEGNGKEEKCGEGGAHATRSHAYICGGGGGTRIRGCCRTTFLT